MPAGLPFSMWLVVGPVLFLLGLTFALFVLTPKGQRPPDDQWNGSFYSNPNDPALLVPKRRGIGYTLNFAHPWSKPVMGVILIVALVPLMWVLMTATHLKPQPPR
jgi:uncharacterized membrane protein